MEEWASSQTPASLVAFAGEDGEVPDTLKAISERAAKNSFHYSRFFAIGLFRLLECAKSSDPAVLEQVSSVIFPGLVFRGEKGFVCKCNAADAKWKHRGLQLAKALNVSKLKVDRDLDVYRNLLSKLVQAKELVKEYVER